MTEQQQSGRELAVVPATTPAREVARTDTDSWIGVLQNIGHLAELICGTEFVPKNLRNSAPATAAAIMYGREVGLPPMTALTQTHVIEGKPAMSAEAMRAMVIAGGHDLVFDEVTGAVCTMRARRAGSDHWTTLSWTIDMARAAGVAGKDNWKHYPRAMLIARCTSDLCRMVFPDVIHGFRALEEVQDFDESAPSESGGAERPTGTTKVTRKRATKAPAPAARNSRAIPAAPPAGPPLPGEPGYDDTTEPAGEVESDDRGEATRGAEPDGAEIEGSTSPVTEPPGPAATPATQDAEFPSAGPGAETGEPGEGAGDVPTTEDPGSPDSKAGPRPIGRGHQRALMAQFGEFGLGDDREERLAIVTAIVGREVESTNNLTADEAHQVMDTLARVQTREALYALLDTIDQANAERAAAESGDES